jgi:hypothetical protein
MKYNDRANIAKHPLAKQLFTIMDLKQTNLAFAADVSQSSELLQASKMVTDGSGTVSIFISSSILCPFTLVVVPD